MLYSELITAVLDRAMPEGVARNLRDVYSKRILDGLIEAQRWVPYLKARQYTLYPFASGLYRQGTTVINRPRGKVRRVQTFNSKTLRDAVYYDSCQREDVDRIIAQRARTSKYPEAVPAEFGSFYADSTLDKGYRAERGLFCVDKDQVILLPHVDSNERVMIEWEGSKTLYADGDVVDYGKYQEQVYAALENWLRWKSVGKDDRSVTDYSLLQQEWRESIAGLQLDTKDDTEAMVLESDLGELPRTWMPAPVLPWSLQCSYDPTNAFFSNLWMLCLTNNKFYNLGALLHDAQVVEMVSGNGNPGGRPEVTYETIRAALVNLMADDTNFYNLAISIVDSQPVHGFAGGAVDTTGKTICDGTSCVNLDVLCTADNNYYRINLVLQDGVPVVGISTAPDLSETPAPVPTVCGNSTVITLKDSVTQKCVQLRVKDGQVSISDV